jgi:hypothetical protein
MLVMGAGPGRTLYLPRRRMYSLVGSVGPKTRSAPNAVAPGPPSRKHLVLASPLIKELAALATGVYPETN